MEHRDAGRHYLIRVNHWFCVGQIEDRSRLMSASLSEEPRLWYEELTCTEEGHGSSGGRVQRGDHEDGVNRAPTRQASWSV